MATFLQKLSRGIQSKGLPIIMVHGVFTQDINDMTQWNPLGKHLHASQFKTSLEKLCSDFKPISLNELCDHQQQGTWPQEPSFVLTFDDGYAGFEEIILPVLERHQCPASFFVTTDFLDGKMMWMDRVEALIHSSDNFTTPNGELKPALEAHRAWNQHLKTKTIVERQEILDKYFTLPASHKLAAHHKAISWDECRRLSQHELVSIGNHTLSHPILANEDKETMSGEILGAAERLRHELGDCDLFCYPNGGDHDHNNDTRHMIEETHHRCALLTHEALTTIKTNPYLLPRFSLSANTFDSSWFWNGVWGLRDLKKKIWK